MPAVTVPKAKKVIPQTNVDNIVFPECPQILLSFDVKSFDLIEDVGFQQGIHIRLNRMGAGSVLPRSPFQKALVNQCIPD